MGETIQLTVYSPERKLLEKLSVEYVILTGSEGQLQILPGHSPMIGTLETGLFLYRVPGETETEGVISSGFFEINGDQVTVAAETLELQAEIDVERARKAQQGAEQVLRDAEFDEAKFRKFQLKLQRALIRQQIAAKSRRGS
jgi:F-type H+-transporting ATPase subunit epsilon